MSPGPGPKLGPGTHEHPGVRSYIAPVNCRRQEGQIVPALVMLMLALVVIGLLFFKVARAALFPPRAQTAADAAALAAAKNVKDQLYRQMATTGTADPELIDPAEVNAAAAGYADKNDAHLTRAVELHGVDVKVWAATNDSLGENARPVDQQDTKAEARARARVEFSVLSGGGGSLPSIGSMGGGGDPTISDKEWNKLRKEISDPPTCGNDAASNDLVTLGKLLQKHGFQVGENADFGTPVGKHDEHGFHYRCRNSAAIDVNHDGAGQAAENAAINPLVKTLNDLGFRTIWQAEGHFDHIHIHVARSGNAPPTSPGPAPSLDRRWARGSGPAATAARSRRRRSSSSSSTGTRRWRRSTASAASAAGSSAGRPPPRWPRRSARRSTASTRGRRSGCPRSRRRSSSRACTTCTGATATRWGPSSSGPTGGRSRNGSTPSTRPPSTSRRRCA